MFDKKEYREMFSQVTASGDTYRRVMTMKNERKQKRGGRSLARIALAAALIALMVLTVSASETVQNWFIDFFADRNGGELSQEQVEYIEENAQPILDSQTHDGWTVELRTAIHDGATAYIIFHVRGPEDVDLTDWTDDEGNVQGQILFGNSGMPGYITEALDYFNFPKDIKFGSWGETWLEDADGLPNTRDLLFTLNPDMMRSKIDPFGPEAVYHFYFENIVWSYTDMDCYRQLMDGKYAGQDGVMLTDEENRQVNRWDTLAEGVWKFDIVFSETPDGSEAVEMLTEPVTTEASIFRHVGDGIEDYLTVREPVTLTSVQLRHLTVTFAYADCNGAPDFVQYEGDQVTRPCVVLKDGTKLELLPHGFNGNGLVTMETEQPIVFADVDYIRMADGTKIEMPE